MKTMQQRKSASSFTQAGFNPDMAQFLSQFEPEMQVKLLDQLWSRGSGGQAGGLENRLSGLGQPQQQQQQRSVADTFSQPPLKEQRANEQLNIARETLAHRKSGDYISSAQSKSESAQKAIPILNELLKLNSGGNLNQGIFGYVPFKNEQSQEFEALLNQLPVEKGSATEAKLRQLANPKLAQRPAVREKILRTMLAERERDAEMGNAVNQVLEQSNGRTPADLQQQVARLLKGKTSVPQMQQQLTHDPSKTPLENIEAATSPKANVEKLKQENNPQQGYGASDIAQLLGKLGIKGLEGAAAGSIGLPKDILSAGTTAMGLPNEALKQLTGGVGIPGTDQILSSAKQGLNMLPSGEDVRQKISGAIPESLQPKGDNEQLAGDIVSDVASFLIPSALLGGANSVAGLIGKGSPWLAEAAQFLKVSPTSAAAVSAAGNTAKWLAKKVGMSENEQTLAKMGGMLAVGVVGGRAANNKVSALNNEIEQAIQKTNTRHNLSTIDALNRVSKVASRGAPSPIKDALKEQISAIPSDNVPLSMYWDIRKTATEALKDPSFTEASKSTLTPLINQLDKEILSVSKKVSPEVGAIIAEHADLSNAVKETSRIQEFLKKNLVYRSHSPLVTGLLGIAGYTRPKLIGVIPAGLAAGEVERTIRMALKSPAFRKYYGDFITAASMGNASALNKAARALDNVVEKESKD
jgi:hypothetical protein